MKKNGGEKGRRKKTESKRSGIREAASSVYVPNMCCFYISLFKDGINSNCVVGPARGVRQAPKSGAITEGGTKPKPLYTLSRIKN
jgi:hypothetical protein